MQAYKSKIEYGLYLVLFLLACLPIGIMLIKKAPVQNVLIYGVVLILVSVFLCYAIFSIKYIVKEGGLKITVGFIYNKDINISEIKSIKRYHSLIAYPTPAASLDRLEINYGKFDSVVISPENRRLFVDCLISENPNIKNYLEKES